MRSTAVRLRPSVLQPWRGSRTCSRDVHMTRSCVRAICQFSPEIMPLHLGIVSGRQAKGIFLHGRTLVLISTYQKYCQATASEETMTSESSASTESVRLRWQSTSVSSAGVLLYSLNRCHSSAELPLPARISGVHCTTPRTPHTNTTLPRWGQQPATAPRAPAPGTGHPRR